MRDGGTNSIAYRPDIDGLRAIAVLAVVFYHAGFDWITGGYVGVDVFFVISGFLITSLILREEQLGVFSFRDFYLRRVRRLVPVLIALMCTVLAIGYWLFTPEDLASLGLSALSALLFVSNFFFWANTGYFAPDAHQLPLLHLWSLSVEEQFYLGFPIVLITLLRFAPNAAFSVVLGIGLASFLISATQTDGHPAAAFFLTPTRVWELMAGAALAFRTASRLPTRRLASLTGLLGLTLIVIACLLFSQSTSFPGYAALLPVLGTMLLIFSGFEPSNPVRRALSVKPLVQVGLISYSLYLWHWPILVFAQYFVVRPLTTVESLVLIVFAVAISAISFRYVEQPFRSPRRFEPRRFNRIVPATYVVLAVYGTVVFASDGFPSRYDLKTYGLSREGVETTKRLRTCRYDGSDFDLRDPACLLGEPGFPTFVLWGDSHARALAPGLNQIAKENGSSGVLATKVACAPLLSIQRADFKGCREFNIAVLKMVLSDENLQAVVLAGRWALWATGQRYQNEDGGLVTFEVDDASASDSDLAEATRRDLLALIDQLAASGKRVFVVSQVPEVGFNVPRLNHMSVLTRQPVGEEFLPTVVSYRMRNDAFLSILSSDLPDSEASIIRLEESLCGEVYCEIVRNGAALYSDDHHLSYLGALALRNSFQPVFTNKTVAR